MKFEPFPKIPRLSREICVTEKLDGSNASVVIMPCKEYTAGGWFVNDTGLPYTDGVPTNLNHGELKNELYVFAGSRNRWISPEKDNMGFAAWVRDHAQELIESLNVGTHFGEWWGRGIQRNYSQTERHFSLFNTKRWGTHFDDQGRVGPCRVVPTLYQGPFNDSLERLVGVREAMSQLWMEGSVAAPGFERPEGIIIYHPHSNTIFKKTLEHDDKGKDHGA